MKERCIQSLVHACQCRDAHCHEHNCQKMKRAVHHARVCMRRANGGCPICKQLTSLSCYHAKNCQQTICPVPFCTNMKFKLRKQQLLQRLQRAQLLRRKMVVMSMASTGNELPGTSNVQMSGGGVQPVGPGAAGKCLASLRPTNQHLLQSYLALVPPQSSEHQQKALAMVKAYPELMEAYIKQKQANQQGLVPLMSQQSESTHTQTVQKLLQVMRSSPSAQQQQQILSILKGNPQLMAEFIKQRQANQQGLKQLTSQQSESTRPQAIEELLQVIESNPSPQKQQQILSILKSNPQLMAEFIKHRQAHLMQQAQGRDLHQEQSLPGLVEMLHHLELE